MNKAVTTPSRTILPLPANRLFRACDLSLLAFATTAELPRNPRGLDRAGGLRASVYRFQPRSGADFLLPLTSINARPVSVSHICSS